MTDDEIFEITPLGAAYVEAMPDADKMATIEKAFQHLKVCPVSACFKTTEEVERFYAAKGDKITAINPNHQ